MKLIMMALLLGVFGPALAWAECAWVLWEQYEFFNVNPGKLLEHGDSKILAAFPTHDACIKAADTRAAQKAIRSPEAVNVKDIQVYQPIRGVFTVHTDFKKPPHSRQTPGQTHPEEEPSWVEVTFQCLPDTVKP